MAKAITLNDEPGEDAGELAAQCADLPDPVPTDWLPQANRFLCPVGAPGRGGILMRKSRLDRLDLAGKLRLYMHDGMGGDVTLPNVRALGNPRCVLPGPADPVYLVQLADRRVDALAATARRYQWRYGPTDPHANAGTTGQSNWAGVARALWPAAWGAFPGMPREVPSSTTAAFERLDVHATRAADAEEDSLAAVGCGVGYDPVDDKFSVVYFPRVPDDAPDAATDVMARFLGRLDYDESPYAPTSAAGPVPAAVVVLFPAWLSGRSDRDPQQVYAVKVSRPAGLMWAAGSTLSPGIVYLQDFTPARCRATGSCVNRALLKARAGQVARIFYDRLTEASPQWPIARAYRGLLNDPKVRPGGTFDLVGWVLDPRPLTIVARSGLVATTPLYKPPALSGLLSAASIDGLSPKQTDDGVPVRVGGYPPELDRERDSWGWSVDRAANTVSIAGAGLGPLLRRGSALRQGEWTSVGTGGRVLERARLWRNWDDPPTPDDMTRFVKVTGGPVMVRIEDEGADTLVYPAVVQQQAGAASNWPQEEACWLEPANPGDELELHRVYLSHAGPHATGSGSDAGVAGTCVGQIVSATDLGGGTWRWVFDNLACAEAGSLDTVTGDYSGVVAGTPCSTSPVTVDAPAGTYSTTAGHWGDLGTPCKTGGRLRVWACNDESTSPNCQPCGWLRDRQALIDGNRILKVYFYGNTTPGGRCVCFPTQGASPDFPAGTPWIAVYDAGADLWLLRANPQSCCSCGSMALNITGQPIDPLTGDLFPTITATLIVSQPCGGGDPYTFDMVYECCTDDRATFTGYGPELCNESMPADGWPCDNTFKMIVSCSPCDVPGVRCDVCRETCAPPYWQLIAAGFTGGYAAYNGDWWLQPDDEVACLWSVICKDILITLTLTVVGGEATATVVFAGAGGGTLTYTFSMTPSPEGNPYPTFLCFDGGITANLSGYHPGAAGSVSLFPSYCDTCPRCCPSTSSIHYLWTLTGPPSATATCPGYTLEGDLHFFGLVDPATFTCGIPIPGPVGHAVRLWVVSDDVSNKVFFWCDPTTGFYTFLLCQQADCLSPGGELIYATTNPDSGFDTITVTCDRGTLKITGSGTAVASSFWTGATGTLVLS